MKFKINKACDLSSISVLPPHSRPNTVPNRQVMPGSGRSQPSQHRSQQSQQSFSQGLSSQHGMLSQISQNSFDEIMANDQKIGSQEREISTKRLSCLAPLSHTRVESQLPISRSSANLKYKWNSTAVPDYRSQISEELEHRIGMMETSLSKFAMILDSVQGDVMQVNKGTKEVSLETESIRQKLSTFDNSLQLLNKGQEEIKANLENGLKSISDKLSKDPFQDKVQETHLKLSALPERIEAFLLHFQNDIRQTLSKERQAATCSNNTNQKFAASAIFPQKDTDCHVATHKGQQPLKNLALPPKFNMQASLLPKVELGSWTSVKPEQSLLRDKDGNKEIKQKGVSTIEQEKQSRVIIDSDEEIDGGFSCLLEEKETEIEEYSPEEVKKETERILRKARRRKRKHCSTIIIN